jgi:sodium/proline symporter
MAITYEATTFTDLLAKHFGNYGKIIRLISAIVIVFFFFFYVGAQFIGGGKTINSLFNIDPFIGTIIIAAIIIPYAVYGGFKSVVYADVIQSLLMIFILIVTPIVGIIIIANNHSMFAHSIPQALNNAGDSYISLFGDTGNGFVWGTFIAGISWFFGYLGGQPQLSIRFMAIKDNKNATQARNIGIIWTILAYIGALSIGWIGIAYFGPNSLSDSEQVMPRILMEFFPPVLTAILTTGIIAAIMSTADSLLILSATELSESLIKPFWIKNAKNPLFISRITTVIIALLALLAAFFAPTNLIYTLVGYVWAGIGGTFSIVILFMLFWKRFHGIAAILTILSGITFTIIWISTGMENIISSRLLTFVVAGIIATLSTLLIKIKHNENSNI